MTTTPLSTDVLVIGWGLSGLVAAAEATAAGRRVIILDQESRSNLGGQAWWSFGGLFFIDSPEQRRMGVKDSLELATQDWFAMRASTARRTSGRARGRRRTSSSPRARSARGCASAASGSSPSSAGPSAAATARWGPATQCRGSTSHGAPDPASSPPSRKPRRAPRMPGR